MFGYGGKATHLFLQKAGLLDYHGSNAEQCVEYSRSQTLVMWVKGHDRKHEIHMIRVSGRATSG